MPPLQPPGNERAFFEIAATLIPLLLFGGVLIERAKPPTTHQWKRQHALLVIALVVFGAIALLAEALAIEAVVTGEPAVPTRVLVVTILITGMTGVVLAISMPWLSRLRQSDHTSYRAIAVLSLALLTGVVISAFGILIDGTNLAAQKERLNAYEKALAKNLAEQDAARRRSDSLSLELDRLNGRLAIALGHRDTPAAEALSSEIKLLNVRISSMRATEERLFLQAFRLEKGARGEPLPPPGVFPP